MTEVRRVMLLVKVEASTKISVADARKSKGRGRDRNRFEKTTLLAPSAVSCLSIARIELDDLRPPASAKFFSHAAHPGPGFQLADRLVELSCGLVAGRRRRHPPPRATLRRHDAALPG